MWRHGLERTGSTPIADSGLAALDRIWPRPGTWRRSCVAYCKLRRRPGAGAAPKVETLADPCDPSVPARRMQAYKPEKTIGLVACELMPHIPQLEIERDERRV